MSDADAILPGATRRRALWKLGRAALFLGGLALVVFLVKQAGVRRVAEVLAGAGPWFLPVLALDAAFMICESLAIRDLLGASARKVPAAVWVRSAALAYALMILLPAGKAAGEVARATALARHVDKGKVAFAAARLSGASLLAIAAMSAVAAPIAACFGEPGTKLSALSALNALVTAGLGGTLVALSRNPSLRRRLLARFPSLDDGLHKEREGEPAPLPVTATLLCFSARCVQVVQYGLVLAAVGGAVTVPRAILASGAHLVSATIGDLVPAQMGVNEGAYTAFAGSLGLAHAPERAISIALIVRIAQLVLASICLTVATLLAPRSKDGP